MRALTGSSLLGVRPSSAPSGGAFAEWSGLKGGEGGVGGVRGEGAWVMCATRGAGEGDMRDEGAWATRGSGWPAPRTLTLADGSACLRAPAGSPEPDPATRKGAAGCGPPGSLLAAWTCVCRTCRAGGTEPPPPPTPGWVDGVVCVLEPAVCTLVMGGALWARSSQGFGKGLLTPWEARCSGGIPGVMCVAGARQRLCRYGVSALDTGCCPGSRRCDAALDPSSITSPS